MVYLLIDTSSDYTFVVVRDAAGRFAQRQSKARLSHNEDLALLVKESFAELELKPKAATKIILGEGPGSFTGLRIGFAFTKALAMICSAPVLLVPSFQIFAAADLLNGRPVICIADARRGEYFSAAYFYKDRIIHSLAELSLRDVGQLKQLISEIKVHTEDPRLLLPQNLHAEFQSVECSDWRVGAKEVFDCLMLTDRVFDAFDANCIARLEPLYVRKIAAKTIAERQKA